ncbi:MAG: thioredoxin domain-containing protein, partial [Flavisolibacter sp.]
FYFTHKEQLDIPVRKKEIYDGATPSGNSMMAYNLYRLSILFDEPAWRERSARMVGSLGGAVFQHPTSFGIWLQLIFEQSSGTSEIAIIGKEWENYLENLLGIYISHKLALASANPLPGYPLLANKAESSITRIYLCENYACRQPVNTIPEFVSLLQAK